MKRNIGHSTWPYVVNMIIAMAMVVAGLLTIWEQEQKEDQMTIQQENQKIDQMFKECERRAKGR